MDILKISHITKRFGGVRANDNISLSVHKGEILGMIGHNGAGKTTLFNVITGSPKPDSGRIVFREEDITALPPNRVAAKGIARTFQISTLFRGISVYQNINVAHYLFNRRVFWKFILNTIDIRRKEREINERTERLIDTFGLQAFRDEPADSLPYGIQRVLGVSMAMALEPKLILLDEPVVGMNETETVEMIEHIKRIREAGTTVVIIEHDMRALMGVSDRVIAFSAGKKIAEGTPTEIQKEQCVIDSYLGKDEDFGFAVGN